MSETTQASTKLKRHPLSAVWGGMPPEQFAELVDDVREHGLLYPVVVLDGQVLDGWHRYRAALEAGVECPTRKFVDGDAAGYVIRNNALRRNLTASQRAAMIVKCREWKPLGANQNSGGSEPGSYPPADSSSEASESEMAAEAGTSDRTIRDAKAAERAGLGDKVRSGEMSAKAAAKQARKQAGPEPEQPGKWTQAEAEKLDALTIRFMELHAVLRDSAPRVLIEFAPRTARDRLRSAARRVVDWVTGTLEVPKTKAYDALAVRARQLSREAQEKAALIDDLEERVAFIQAESEPVAAVREAKFHSYRAQISTLKSQVAHWQAKYGEAERENKALRRRLRAHGESIKP